jgi:hypothetical protein
MARRRDVNVCTQGLGSGGAALAESGAEGLIKTSAVMQSAAAYGEAALPLKRHCTVWGVTLIQCCRVRKRRFASSRRTPRRVAFPEELIL